MNYLQDNKISAEKLKSILAGFNDSKFSNRYKMDYVTPLGLFNSFRHTAELVPDPNGLPEESTIRHVNPNGVIEYRELFLNLKDPRSPENISSNKSIFDILKTTDFTGFQRVRTKGLIAFQTIEALLDKYIIEKFNVSEYSNKKTETIFFAQYGRADVMYKDYDSLASLSNPHISFFHIKEIHPDLYIVVTSFIDITNTRRHGIVIVALTEAEDGAYNSLTYSVPLSHIQSTKKFSAETCLNELRYSVKPEGYEISRMLINSDNINLFDIKTYFQESV